MGYTSDSQTVGRKISFTSQEEIEKNALYNVALTSWYKEDGREFLDSYHNTYVLYNNVHAYTAVHFLYCGS